MCQSACVLLCASELLWRGWCAVRARRMASQRHAAWVYGCMQAGQCTLHNGWSGGK